MRLPSIPPTATDLGARMLRRFVEIEGAQQATVLAAQAFTSLIPFLVVTAAFGPGEGDLADRIVERFGLNGSAETSVRALFNSAGDVESAVTWVSIVILILAAVSFTRALQRMFERAYREAKQGLSELWRGLAWLAGFALWIAVSAPLRETLADFGSIAIAVGASAVLGFVLWLWTPVILLSAADRRRLVPGAIVSGVLTALVGIASGIYVPILMTWSAERYGLIGVAFSLQSWLVVMGFVIVIGAVVGAVVSEQYGDEIDGLTIRRRRD